MTIIFLIVGALILVFGFVVFFGAPYVPSKINDTRRAFDKLYHLKPSDLLLDLGSGDGIVLREAARRGARAVGYELNPILVAIANFISRKDNRVSSTTANFFTKPFPDETTIVYVFGDARDIKKIVKRIQSESDRLNKSIRVISYGFSLPNVKPIDKTGAHFLYVIKPLQAKKPQV